MVGTLVYHAGALGDFITALPAICAWKRTRTPGRRLVLFGRPAHAVLAAGVADETWDAGAAKFASLFSGEATADVRSALFGVESALVFAPHDAGIVRGFESAGVRDIVRGDPFPRVRMHVVDHHLSLFDESKLTAEDRMPRVAIGAVSSTTRPIVFHPGSGSPTKNWPFDRFVSVAAALADAGPIAWVVGPVEKESAVAVTIEADTIPGAAVWRSLPLADLAARLAGARLLIGNDSGVAHLAAAVGCPVVVLFGASDPVVWAPRGSSVTVIGDRTCGMEAIRIDEVVRAARTALAADRLREGIPPG